MTELEERVIREALLLVPQGCYTQRAKATIAVDQIRERDIRRDKKLDEVREAVAQLRLDTAYIIFDLQATRKERDELRQKYEN